MQHDLCNSRFSKKLVNGQFTPLKAKLHQLFYKVTMKKWGSDSVDFVTDLENIQSRLADAGNSMTDEHFVLQILNTLTKGYATEVCLIEEQLDMGDPVTIDGLKDSLALECEREIKRNGEDMLMMIQMKKKREYFVLSNLIEGQCNYHGKCDNEVSEYDKKKNVDNDRFQA